MTRASISLTAPNDAWIQSQIESQEFASRSEVVNDLIRKARKQQDDIETIRLALVKGEASGVSNRTPEEIINSVIEKRRDNGEL